jgi:hypothetical protein
MKQPGFTSSDLLQMKRLGISPQAALRQLESFKKGFPFMRLLRPCVPGNGIRRLRGKEIPGLIRRFEKEMNRGRVLKFVPASGAASRMFKSLLAVKEFLSKNGSLENAKAHLGRDWEDFSVFIKSIRHFAFYPVLEEKLRAQGLRAENLLARGQYLKLLQAVLDPEGLHFAAIPKGLIPFHRYGKSFRTAFEEHLAEAAVYACDQKGNARLHFTVAGDYEPVIRRHLTDAGQKHGQGRRKFKIGFSIQKTSTDTLAADRQNRPFRDGAGKLVFRAGGHGALLENLNDLKADIVFIKNIDNVVPDHFKADTYRYKKALGGYLTQLQEKVFGFLKMLSSGRAGSREVSEALQFARRELLIHAPGRILKSGLKEKTAYLISKLNRPIRVCGMVKNEGEPGGGPFWTKSQGGISPQIVESSQVNMKSEPQERIWKKATHFNPVDLVCGVSDFRGRPFDLKRFVDPETGFISVKSSGGKDLKAMELPGLWNGAMADWNTVFVEVPISTFHPVKTVLDLLRKSHQPQ